MRCRTACKAARGPPGLTKHEHRTIHAHTHTRAAAGRLGRPHAANLPERHACISSLATAYAYLQTHGEERKYCQQPGEAVNAANSARQRRRHGTDTRVPLAYPVHRCLWRGHLGETTKSQTVT